VGEGGARAAQRRGRVRGNEDGLTKRQLLPASTVARSRRFRRDAGAPEQAMWAALRRALPQAKFRRQVPLGPYFADFCSHAARLIIEIDDATHALKPSEDAARTRFLESEGYRVIRFWNHDVMQNRDGVIAAVANALPEMLRESVS